MRYLVEDRKPGCQCELDVQLATYQIHGMICRHGSQIRLAEDKDLQAIAEGFVVAELLQSANAAGANTP